MRAQDGAGPTPEVARRERSGIGAGVVMIAFLTGCSSGLRPGPDARVTGDGTAAVGGAANVRMVFEPGAWKGFPRDIKGHRPVLVHIRNDGSRPVQIRYDRFGLGSDTAAVSPADPTRMADRQLVNVGREYGASDYIEYFTHSGFHFSHRYSGPGLFSIHGGHLTFGDGTGSRSGIGRGRHGGFRHSGFGHGFHGHGFGHGFHGHGFGHGYHGPGRLARLYHHRSAHVDYTYVTGLPTRDMLEKAVAEGTLEPGGRLTGYLYFPETGDSSRELAFSFQVRDAEADRSLGRILIPLVR